MTDNTITSSRGIASRRLVAALSLFAAGFTHALLHPGAFGAHDVAARAAISGAAASAAYPLFALLVARWRQALN
jgi:hypothetical protein